MVSLDHGGGCLSVWARPLDPEHFFYKTASILFSTTHLQRLRRNCSSWKNKYYGKQVPCMLMGALEKMHAGADA